MSANTAIDKTNDFFDFKPEYCRNEKEVEGKLIIQYLLPNLGYQANSWFQEVAFGNIRLDFLAFATQALPFTLSEHSPLSLVIEAKHPNQSLDSHVYKLGNYLRSLRVVYGVLTNAKEFRIYEHSQNQVFLKFSCAGSEISANLESIKDLIGKKELKPPSLNPLEPVNSQDDSIKPQEYLPLTSTVQKSMKVIAVYHNKGGVGKTTTVVNLAAALAKQGQRVLIIDLDSQANTTFAVGLVKFLDETNDDIKGKNITQVIGFKDSYGIEDVVRKTTFSKFNIDVIPAHIELMEYEINFTNIEASKTRLHGKLNKVKDQYDIVLIDTPPSLNLYAKIALITAQYLIIPSDLKPFSHEGLNNVKNFIEQIKETKEIFSFEPLKIIGVLPSKISTNPKFIANTLPKRRELIISKYGFPAMDSMICEREDLAKCLENSVSFGDDMIPDPRSVMDFKPDSTSAKEFELLALEVMEKIGLPV